MTAELPRPELRLASTQMSPESWIVRCVVRRAQPGAAGILRGHGTTQSEALTDAAATAVDRWSADTSPAAEVLRAELGGSWGWEPVRDSLLRLPELNRRPSLCIDRERVLRMRDLPAAVTTDDAPAWLLEHTAAPSRAFVEAALDRAQVPTEASLSLAVMAMAAEDAMASARVSLEDRTPGADLLTGRWTDDELHASLLDVEAAIEHLDALIEWYAQRESGARP
ncbi:hypothetical protein DWB68_15110 [Galactobacter valiniphilus]|uniref:Uncharacterized protein n=1 Tax=Galactobacter valiniphilus TaxID=2676122 RepID=A0A399JEE0_9MICC|nr:hypothetical protein [Galactobacter valiniphilus]RII40976.1 hypothetical protein DWB68_15110 [Galactobacter valiniphilus]